MNDNETPQPPTSENAASEVPQDQPESHPTAGSAQTSAEQPTGVLGESEPGTAGPSGTPLGDKPSGGPPPVDATGSGQPNRPPTAAQPPPASSYQAAAGGPTQSPGYQQQPGYQQPAGGQSGYQPASAYPPPGGYVPPGAGYPPPGAYPPPGGAGTLPPSSAPPSGYQPPPTPPGPVRRLTRSRTDRMIGGVCGGLARYWNTDATLLRILTVVLTLATGGAFLIGYLIAWIAIPDDPMNRPPGYEPPADHVGYASGGNPSYAEYSTTTQYVPPAPRERSYLGWLALSLAILAAGVLGLIGFLVPASVGIWGIILAVALTILGLGLLVGSRYGRARWLLWFAVPLAFVTFATVSASNFVRDNPDWNRWVALDDSGGWGGLTIGDRTWVVEPEDAADSPLEYRLSAGSAVLDLTELSALSGGEIAGDQSVQQLTIDAGVGVGELVILIPPDMELELDARVNAGQIDTPSTDVIDGTDLDLETTIGPLANIDPTYTVTIDAAMGAGNLEVRREAA